VHRHCRLGNRLGDNPDVGAPAACISPTISSTQVAKPSCAAVPVRPRAGDGTRHSESRGTQIVPAPQPKNFGQSGWKPAKQQGVRIIVGWTTTGRSRALWARRWSARCRRTGAGTGSGRRRAPRNRDGKAPCYVRCTDPSARARY
jgi:hypothetical protein